MADASDRNDSQPLEVVFRRERIQDLDIAVVARAAPQVEHKQRAAEDVRRADHKNVIV